MVKPCDAELSLYPLLPQAADGSGLRHAPSLHVATVSAAYSGSGGRDGRGNICGGHRTGRPGRRAEGAEFEAERAGLGSNFCIQKYEIGRAAAELRVMVATCKEGVGLQGRTRPQLVVRPHPGLCSA